MTQKQSKKPNNKYGKVFLSILTNKVLSKTARVVYSLLAVKQGSSQSAKLTQSQVADSLNLGERTIRDAFRALKDNGTIEPVDSGWKVIQPETINQYGYVEQIVLGSNFISNTGKLLYSYYSIVTSGVPTCSRSAETITKELGISKKSYHDAFKELKNLGLLVTDKQPTKHGYVNVVAPRRLKTANPKDFLPASWFPENITLDVTDVDLYKVIPQAAENAKINALNRQLENHLKGEKEATNINHNTNHNIEPVPVAITTGIKIPDDRSIAQGEEEQEEYETIDFPESVFAAGFKYDINDLRAHKNILYVFKTIRDKTGQYSWRINIEDYSNLKFFVNNHLNSKTFESIVDYIVEHRPNATSLSYFLSVITSNLTVEGLSGETEEYRWHSDFYKDDDWKNYEKEQQEYKMKLRKKYQDEMADGITMAPVKLVKKKDEPVQKFEYAGGEIEDILGL